MQRWDTMGVFPPFWPFYCNFGKIHWMRKIQMVDTKNQYLAIKEEVDLAIQNVLDTAAYINGKAVQDFSKNLGAYLGVQYVVPCANGTDALQIAMMALDLQPGDEVITPSFTYIATTEVVALLKLTPVFVDVDPVTYCMDIESLKKAITPKTKAIVPVHYAGIACDMDLIMDLADKYNLLVIEDAAQAIDSFYIGKDGKKRTLGAIGHLAAFSFHETKNIISGEGGMLTINDDRFIERAEIIWEKGTNRSQFFRGEVDKYGWVDIGSSFLPSEIIAAFLWAQLENLQKIQTKRKEIWNDYYSKLNDWAKENEISLPKLPTYATNNAHMFFISFENLEKRTHYIEKLNL